MIDLPKTRLGQLETIDQMVRHAIIERLLLFKGNKTEAAKSLGISRANIYFKIKKFGL